MNETAAPIGSGRTVIVGPVRYAELCGRGRQLLVDNGFTLIENESTVPWEAEQLNAVIGSADAAVVGVEVFDEAALRRAGSLRILSRLGVGLDNIDLEFARERGVDVVNVPGGNAAAVAELALGLILGSLRNITRMDRAVRDGQWDRYVGRELAGKTICLLGFGATAQVTARRLSGFGVTVRAYDPYGDAGTAADLGVELVSLQAAVAEADVVSVHVPHVPSTHHLVDDALIARMQTGVVIINTSRGGTVDEAALLRGLDSGRVAGAGLDVFETEPADFRNPLFSHESVITSPHAAADTLEAYERIGWATAQAIVDVFSGKPPANVAN